MSNEKQQPRKVDTTSALAQYLGLSRWTISRVLNGHPGVKAETRERVRDAVVELGFEPNMMARGLRGSNTRLIGVCFQEIESPVLARKTACLQNLIRREDYRGIIELTGGDPRLEEEVIRHFFSLRVDGIVLVGSTLRKDHPLIGQMVDGAAPVVAVDPGDDLPLSQVNLDREHAMDLKVAHLRELGHERFCILGMESDPVYGPRRISGLRRAARRHGLDFRRDFVSLHLPGFDLQDYNYGYELGRRVLGLEAPLPTALIALNDRIAIGAIKALREQGCRVPEDISIVGFDNLEVAEWTVPALTTIDQQVELLMSTAVGMLMKMIRSGEPGNQPEQRIRPAIKVRGSTAPCPGRTVPTPSVAAPKKS